MRVWRILDCRGRARRLPTEGVRTTDDRRPATDLPAAGDRGWLRYHRLPAAFMAANPGAHQEDVVQRRRQREGEGAVQAHPASPVHPGGEVNVVQQDEEDGR